MIGVAINGACGRMGLATGRLILGDNQLRISAAIEVRGSQALGRDYGELLGAGPIGVKVTDKLHKGPDVLIDFSVPVASLARLRECVRLGIPAVVGTTGFTQTQLGFVRAAAKRIPCLVSPNMSLGMNLLFKVGADIARLLDNHDVEIVELHHRYKREAPSGSAKILAKRIARARNTSTAQVARYGRKGNAPRRDGEICIHAVRGGDIVGEHRLMFARGSEVIELMHRVTSRDVFAEGAIQAAKLLVGKMAGLYSMEDILFT
jgi:4-hydroxy-tetrahydrodipicolinate reductase